ncbi:hypothetical protein WMZ97_03105 [Lentibacillus sp. N15]|uniref:hypothetical protein n=1 Tax=Lentibacillus songyuanensis TaxID=3136161 RepID=UPI0031BB0D46
MLFAGVQWINKGQLLTLGLTEKQLYFIIILIGVFASYYIIQPVVYWFVTLQSTKVLSYMIASLVMMICVLVFDGQQSDDNVHQLIKITLQCLAAFGGVLFVIQLVSTIANKSNKKSV